MGRAIALVKPANHINHIVGSHRSKDAGEPR